METKMEKTAGRFVITAQKNPCCSYQGGRKKYYFCNGSTELVRKLFTLYGKYSGDWLLTYDEEDDLAEEDKIAILKAEKRRESNRPSHF
jgi:hypothetical protein